MIFYHRRKEGKQLQEQLERIVGAGNVHLDSATLGVYDFDASLCRGRPDAVVFATTAGQVSGLVKLANRLNMPFVARGAGTNLSGGTVLLQGGLVIDLGRMNSILEIDTHNRTARVEPGVVNQKLQDALRPHGFYYAPDPASLKVSTLGGNVAENSGGPRCLKYGVTSNHILGLEIVLPDGEIVRVGGNNGSAGPDLVGLFVGSEGTLGIATQISVRILRLPERVVTILTVFESLEAAGRSVADIIAAGIVPASLEIMDNLVIQAVEDSVQAGYPRSAEAVLIIELDGIGEGMEENSERIVAICEHNGVGHIRRARSTAEREELWRGRRGAFGAVARIQPNYLVCDATVPRSQLPAALAAVKNISRAFDLPIGNVFHAGDGNLHPLILFDGRKSGELQRVHAAAEAIMRACVDLGGTISGEHGIGVEKLKQMRFLFSEDDLHVMERIKTALDPKHLCNPGKAILINDTGLQGAKG